MKTILTLLCMFCLASGHGQQVISGRVIDDAGQPVPFASIAIYKNRHSGVSADKNGNFKLEGVNSNDTLLCTHINYEGKKEAAGGNYKIVFRLTKKLPVVTPLSATGASLISEIRPVKQAVIKSSSSPGYPEEPKIFAKIEIPAHFGMYDNSLKSYLENKLVITDSLPVPFNGDEEFHGTATAHFTVDRTGKVVNVFIVRGLGEAIDQLVLNAITAMPLWQPAFQNGIAIDSEQEVSVYFYIQRKSVRH